MKHINIKDINKKDLLKIKKLYLDCFEDTKKYIDAYFGIYSKNVDFWYEKNENQKIKMIASLSKKRLIINNQKCEAGLINSIAVDTEFRNQKLMTNFFKTWLTEIQNIFPYIFIQAYNWDIYKNFDFIPITYKSEWILRKDQFLKPETIYQEIDYQLMNKTYLEFLKNNKIKNYVYKTSKEFKTYYKIIVLDNDRIIQSKKAWIIISNNVVEDFAFVDLKEFIKLISQLPLNTKILSYIDLDKRFFIQVSDKKVSTKILKAKKALDVDDIYFNDSF